MNIAEFSGLDVDAMAATLVALNADYRKGEPQVSDDEYNRMRDVFVNVAPDHPFVNKAEGDLIDGKGRIPHPIPMLSTEKAYTWVELYKWLDKVEKRAEDLGFEGELMIRLTPKLDGCAGRFAATAKERFVTRGEEGYGNDFTALGDRLVFVGDDSKNTVGEVVCDEAYYQEKLKPADVKHPRNFVAGLITADNISALGQKALEDGAVRFVSYQSMAGTKVYAASDLRKMQDQLDDIELSIINACPYRTDGVVFQVDDDELFLQMGHNDSHHYGQMAKKIAGEAVEVEVENVTFQVGRTGRLSPVINITPTEIGGVMVSNVTAHHAGNVKALKIGRGAVLDVLRSGEVIPFCKEVLKPADEANVHIPDACPVCSAEVQWVNDFLECTSSTCAGKVAAHLQFFTKTLNWDLIGGKAAEKLAEGGIDARGILTVDHATLVSLGFGQGQAANIIAERERVFASGIEDAKLLAALGVRMLGQRASRTLLKERDITQVLSFTVDEIAAIEGFAQKKARVIQAGLAETQALLSDMLLHFTQIQSSKVEVTESPITGKSIVFTGAMVLGNRNEMSKHAESLGAKVQSSVSGKTDILVTGEKVGASKIDKANKLNVTIMSEADYVALVGQ